MNYHDRSRSPPNISYSPSSPAYRSRSRSRSPRRYDDRRRRDYRDRDREHEYRVPPPRGRDREYDGRVPPTRDRDREYDDRVPPPRDRDRDRDYYDDRSGDNDRRDRDDGWRDYARDDRRERPSHRREERRFDDSRPPSDPSRDLIFLGLDTELSEKELEGYLRVEHGYNVESCKIVRERASGQSKGFGFAQFATLEQAKRFMDDNYPHVTMPALFGHSEPRRVKIDFAGSRLEDAPAPAPQIGARHDGTRDIGQPGGGSRVLLLRGLDPGTYAGEVVRRLAEEVIRMLGKGTQRDAEACISRVAMIVDRASAISWGFAFVELVTPELASALMPFLFLPQHQPTGFLISGVPIATSFANPNALIPTPSGPMGGQFLLRAAANGGFGAGTIDTPDGEFCTYWHQQAGAVETVPRGAPAVPARGVSLELSDETRRFLGNLAGKWKPPKPTGAAAVATSNVPGEASSSAPGTETPSGPLVGGMQPIKIGFGNAVKKKPKEEPAMVEIMSKGLVDDDDEVDLVGKDSVLLSRTKGAHIVPPTSTSRKVAGFINKWNTKQTELSTPRKPKAPNAPPAGVSAANAAPVVQVPVQHQQPTQPSTSNEFDFGDTQNFATTGKVACLLCQRQFKSEEMLRKHNAQSELHKTNLADNAIREAGKRRKNNALAAQTGSNQQFRDRAAERRDVHQQPDRPALDPDPRRPVGDKVEAAAPKAPAPEKNVGNKLLAKMGWTSGTGLGVNEDGRAEPVQVQQFEERAGLGATAGREAGRWSGPGGWQRRAQDMTQERFQEAERQNQGQN
ncbi:uncharacterized protein CcaverHIS019_0107100 [Cutaneotrichosporon cavernicola]|uniref:G-patch domain-containing protein n=1 Tax=Cutaneotrichosporon cavernicola TaxID=279322 RepID=A0AA48I880_9TREE|nr:uncharacterized protein CcaverHIS019_0107100 [Cutaneotrichosporon cavernicola]BEI87992.1 hypothetical protein CcaverHIS019_0107100 [Cutaneotrichosporon cavernicola]BEI95768.1 hypothetical protein CcaverHIS631_0107170 [Cutaneotrichosporon cavernicola]BEJ03540.1 hypothetical protein CcaverHIS641_0107150 [Cutaneotrichosporon cavernicola]